MVQSEWSLAMLSLLDTFINVKMTYSCNWPRNLGKVSALVGNFHSNLLKNKVQTTGKVRLMATRKKYLNFCGGFYGAATINL